jgi:hypothetical protein
MLKHIVLIANLGFLLVYIMLNKRDAFKDNEDLWLYNLSIIALAAFTFLLSLYH